MSESEIQRTIEAVWRMESAKIIAKLTRMLRQIGLAEEFAQDALVSALERWPRDGVPDKPGAWLMTAAKNRALDELRHRKLIERTSDAIAHELPLGQPAAEPAESADDDIGDDLLRLMFIVCHPVLST
jgi:RNA polymerase sigma-70 factor, ECF subfamily